MKNYPTKASWWKRVISTFIDWYLVYILCQIAVLLTDVILTGDASIGDYGFYLNPGLEFGASILLVFICLLFLVLYYIVLPLINQKKGKNNKAQTIGNILTKTAIVTSEYSNVSWINLFIKNIIVFCILQNCVSGFYSCLITLLSYTVTDTWLLYFQYFNIGVSVISVLLFIYKKSNKSLSDILAKCLVINISNIH